MLLPIKPICKKALMRRDSTSIVFIQYCHSLEKRTLLNTGIAIPPNYWNLKRLRINPDLPACYGNADLLNDQLQSSIRLAEDILTFATRKKIADPLSFLKNTFKPDLDLSLLEGKAKEAELPKVNLDVFFQIDDYIKSKAKHVTPKMLNVYRNMRDTLKAFETYRKKPISFESFDFNFYEEFVEYMMYEHVQRRRKQLIKGFRISTVGKTIKQLRIFLRNRARRKIIAPINLEDFKILDEETDAVYLTWDEIIRIYQTDLSAYAHLCKYRNLFVFGCLTGLRFSDFSTIKSEDVRNRMLYKKQDKSDHWVVIPLRDEAYFIFTREFKRNIPQITNSDFNYYIKEVAKVVGINQLIKFSHKKGNRDIITMKPKYAWITSHTCRRSFCTNEFLAGTPVDLIMKISGHKSLRDFYRYIRITPEEAGQKIREIWQNRGDMSIVKEKEGNQDLLAVS
jgi:integrase